MEYMPEFQVLKPATIKEAVQSYAAHAGAKYLAGGTDLIVNVRRGIAAPETMINLSGIDEITKIESGEDGGLKIGAGVTLNEIIQHPLLARDYAAIVAAAKEVAAPSHRQVATVGGNLCLDTRCVFYNQSEWWRTSNNYCLKSKGDTCHVAPSGKRCFAAFSGDVAPALMVFGAEVELSGPEGSRKIPLPELYQDDGADHLRLLQGEILTAVLLPKPEGFISGYRKARVRGSIDFPLAGVAIALKKGGDKLKDIRVALTGVHSYPLLVDKTDGLIGKPMDAEALVALLPKQIKPMSSTFYAPGYRRKVAANLTRALAKQLFAGA